MRITINYGDGKLTLELPDNMTVDEYSRGALKESTDIMDFERMLSRSKEGRFDIAEAELFIINDAYRPTPTSMILEWLKQLGKLNDTCRFLIAAGCHAEPDERQFESIFGDLYGELKDRIIVHDAHDIESMYRACDDDYDTDKVGQSVYINKALSKFENIVILGSVEPHYFAGFTGGRKSIVPGLCDSATTIRNHRRAVSFEAMPMKLDGNPVAEHLEYLLGQLSELLIISIQIVSDEENRHRLFIGDLQESFKDACDVCREIFGCKYNGEYDLLLAEVASPLDASLYQLQKSLENCQMAVRDGGTVVLFSACHEGIGSSGFYKLAGKWSAGENIDIEDSFGIHKLSRVHAISGKKDLYLYSELDEGVSDKVFFKSVTDIQNLLNEKVVRENISRIALVHDAGHTVLVN